MRVLFASSVGGGPIERLARRLRAKWVTAEVIERFSAEAWHARMGSGSAARLGARLQTFIEFPGQVLARARGPDTVLVPTTNPFFLPLICIATKPLHGATVVPLVYDLYPDAFEVEAGTERSVLSSIFAALNAWWFKRADGVVFIGQRMAEHAQRRYGALRHWDVLETGAEVNEFSAERVGSAAPESELERWCEGRVVLSYVGNMGRMHDVETLAQAIPKLLEHDEARRVGVVIAAFGPGVERLREAWRELEGDERVRFEAPLPDRAWARLLVRTSIALVTLRKEAAHTSIPSKTFSALAAGNAVVVVAPGGADVVNVVEQHSCGRSVEPGDVEGLTHALLALTTGEGALNELRANARAVAREVYDLDRLGERWLAFLQDAMNTAEPVADGVREAA